MTFEIIVNEKLSLKLRQAEDAEVVFLLTDKNRNHLRPWLPWVDTTLTPEDSKKYLEGELKNFENKTGADFGVYYEKHLIGSMGFNKIDLTNSWAEIGYWIDSDFEGKGIITDCVKTIINYGFNDLGLHRIQIRCDSCNIKSKSIPERLGFKLEGVVRENHRRDDRFSDALIYGVLSNEWNND